MFMSINKDAYSQQYNSYAIPELSYWHKSWPNKTRLLPG